MLRGKTVFIGLSGGVDSSVAAARLKARGLNVVGVFIKVWHPDFMVCNWEQERLDAMRVAAHLQLPFLTCDAEEAYKKQVADYFIQEYLAGRTPNPDVLCNQYVKFGAFLEFAKKHGADYVATGHYVQRIDTELGAPELHRGLDAHKDQSYFLWSLSNDQLSHILFPVGDTTKEDVRKEAAKLQLPTAIKKESQGICFLGHIDIPEFLSHYTELKPGAVLNEAGETIGEHRGALVYTLGQRHGFTITTHDTERTAQYVIAKNIANNTITISKTRPEIASSEHISLSNAVLRTTIETGDCLEAQIRYRQVPFAVEVISKTADAIKLSPLEITEKPASGQSCVLYRGTHCIGGGIIG